jgi:CRISPR-associated protein Cas5d
MNDVTGNLLAVRVWGDYACWTRPEMKVERVTYPVMTPTGARGVLEAIFWKPEFSWRVHEIDVLKPVQYFSLTRNEVAQRASPTVRSIDITQARTQRHAVVLRDVAYVISAEILLRPHATDDVAKYRDQFRRRVERGACAHRPYLGTREFPAFFGPPTPGEHPAAGDLHIGPMIADIDYVGGAGSSMFEAEMVDGRVHFPLNEAA